MTTLDDDLANELSELFAESIDLDSCDQRQWGSANVNVVVMSYTHQGSAGGGDRIHRVRVRQTAVVLDDAELDLPQFKLTPTPKRRFGKLTALAGSLGDINFDESPTFSSEYFLHGWVVPCVRNLFAEGIRDYFANHHGWCVVGKGRLLVVYKHDVVCESNQVDSFIRDSMAIMELFQKAEEHLDTISCVQRITRPDDLMQWATQADGLVGAGLRRTLANIAISPKELQNFVTSKIPRKIPRGVKNQVLGNNLPVAIFGAVCLLAGIAFAVISAMFAKDPKRLIGILISCSFIPIGGLMLYFTMRHRLRKARLLRHGTLATGRIAAVEKADTSINHQVRYHVSIAIQDPSTSEPRTVVCNAYGAGADQAKECLGQQKQVQVLIDPNNLDHVVCTQLLMVFRGAPIRTDVMPKPIDN